MDFEELARAAGKSEAPNGGNDGGTKIGENNETKSTGLTSRLWFAWLMFWFVFPYGIYLFWKHKHKKSLYSAVVILALIFFGGNEQSSDTTSSNSAANTASVETQNSDVAITQNKKSEKSVRTEKNVERLDEKKLHNWAAKRGLTHSQLRNFINWLYSVGFEEDRISVKNDYAVYSHKEDELPFSYTFDNVVFNGYDGIKRAPLVIVGPDGRYMDIDFWEKGMYEFTGVANFNDAIFAKKSAFKFLDKKADKDEIFKHIKDAKVMKYAYKYCYIDSRTINFDRYFDLRTNGQYLLVARNECDEYGRHYVIHNGKPMITFDYLFPLILSRKSDIVGEEDRIFEDVCYIVSDSFGNVKGIAPVWDVSSKPAVVFGPYNF